MAEGMRNSLTPDTPIREDTQHDLVTAQGQVEDANVRAVAAEEAEQAVRRADVGRRAKGLLARLRDAWHGE